MFEEKKYFCTETEESFTESELKAFFLQNYSDYDGNFSDYVNGCLVENNGSLMIPKMITKYSNKEYSISVWNIKTNIGQYYIIYRHGYSWKTETGAKFLWEKHGYFMNCETGECYDIVKRISDDCVVIH